MELPRSTRNGHNSIRMLLFLFTIVKQFLFKPMLLSKLKRVYQPFKLPSHCHLLNRFNKHDKFMLYIVNFK